MRHEIAQTKHTLRNLREIDIDNLQCGRITACVVQEVMNRMVYEGTWQDHVVIADELNDMLIAARAVK